MTASGSEKRVYQRKTLRAQVVFLDESQEEFIYFYSTDLSLGGIFLESDIPLKTGTKVSLSFSLPYGDSRIRAEALVVRNEKRSVDSDSIVGVGVQFTHLPEKEKKLIEDFIQFSAS